MLKSALIISLALVFPAAYAIHFDVELRTDKGPVAGSRIVTGFYGDLDLAGKLPIDGLTGNTIYPGYFGDLEGGPYLTDDPGFQAFANTFLPREVIHYRALGTLEYWDPATGRWGPAPEGVEVVLYGGIPEEILIGYTLDPGAWAEQYRFYEQGTRFKHSGISGPPTAVIDDARRDGTFHAHLDWKIRSGSGTPRVGAYLVTLELWSPAQAGGQAKYLPSRPFHVVFERGISEAQMRDALNARISPPVVEPPPPDLEPVQKRPAAPWAAPRRLPWE